MPPTEGCGEPILVVLFYTWPSSSPGKGMRWLPAAIVAVKKKSDETCITWVLLCLMGLDT